MRAVSRIGTLAIAVAAVLWAAGATLAGDMFERGAAVVEMTAARAFIATVGLGALVWTGRRARRRASLAAVVPFGLSIAAANYFYYFSVSRLPVAVAIVIQYTAPGLVVLWQAAVERRAPSRRVAGALVLALAGVALLAELPSVLARGEARLDGLGVAAASASACAFAAYMLLGDGLGRSLGPDGALLRGFAVASAFWVVVLAARGRADTLTDPSFAPGLAFLGVGATIAPFLLFLWGLGRVGPSRAGIVSTLEPLAGAVFAYLWLDQTLGGWQIAGAAMVIAGIGFVQSERPRSPEVLAEAAAVE